MKNYNKIYLNLAGKMVGFWYDVMINDILLVNEDIDNPAESFETIELSCGMIINKNVIRQIITDKISVTN